ncbi:hypothetical protein GMF55_20545 [Salmonella enterica]|nr:hypothetical protein [Salmonella enterica]EGO2244438.1 hypothetical protein [Salmonella enterica]EJE6978109.1 hypothetical protein [Salmonella enterica]
MQPATTTKNKIGVLGIIMFIIMLLFFFPVSSTIILFMIYITAAKTLPVYCLFVVPIAMGILLSLFSFTTSLRRMVYWSTDLSLALSAAVVSIIAITKSIGFNVFENIKLPENEYTAAILSFLAACTVAKLFLILFSFNEYKNK